MDSDVAAGAGTVAGWGPAEGAAWDAGGTGTVDGQRPWAAGEMALILAAVRASIAASGSLLLEFAFELAFLPARTAGMIAAANAIVIINRAAKFIVAP
jgi:hypothetical protein